MSNYQPAEEQYDGRGRGDTVVSRSLHNADNLFTINKGSRRPMELIVDGRFYNLHELPDIEKTILVMRDVLGFQQRTIAEMLGLRTVTIGQYLSYARARANHGVLS